MDLAFIDDIHNYYRNHFELLDNAKRFHFASRLASWSNSPVESALLREARIALLPGEEELEYNVMLKTLLSKEYSSGSIAFKLRKPFFKQYSDLYGLELALFRVRHLKYLYDIDLRETLYSLYPKEKINLLRDQLMHDSEAIKYLSTYAVNFCYLADIVLNEQRPTIDSEMILRIGHSYDQNDSDELQLLLYLYTHCIIAETNFYINEVPTSKLPIYTKMLEHAENIIESHFNDISLDNKLEFLVSTNICHYTSQLRNRIYAECARSLSEDGMFIIDRHNTKVRPERHTFQKSEHRNTLLIMSNIAYQPQH